MPRASAAAGGKQRAPLRRYSNASSVAHNLNCKELYIRKIPIQPVSLICHHVMIAYDASEQQCAAITGNE
jgi:hypothetical protein